MKLDFVEVARQNTQKAWEIIENTRLVEIWESVGAEPRLVGSLKMGLLMKHRDIDFHIYSKPLRLSNSFAAIAKLAEHPAIRKIEYTNLIDTEEKCVEWHAWYQDEDEVMWQIDMIHILKGSFYDGYFEKMAERILAVMTPEQKLRILALKNETPETEKIMGVEYYRAVLQGGVKSYTEFQAWREQHPVTGVLHCMP